MRISTRPLPDGLEIAWLLLGCGTVAIEQRTAAQALSGTIDAANFVRFSFVCTALTIVLLHRPRIARLRINPITIFLAYMGFGLLSCLWSMSAVASLGKAMELTTAALIVWIAMAQADGERRLKRLIGFTIFGAVVELVYVTIGAIVDPADFYEAGGGLFAYALASPRVSSNEISQLGAFVGLFCLARALDRPAWPNMLGYVCCLTFPVLAEGRTGMVSAVVGSALLLVRRRPFAALCVIPPAAALVALVYGRTLVALFLRGQDEQMFMSLSGRTTLWEWGWQGFLRQPFFGMGFGVGSRTVFEKVGVGSVESGYGGLISSLHNGPLEVLLGVGLAGFIIWAIAILWGWRLAAAAYLRGERLDLTIGMVVAISSTFLSIGLGGWLDIGVGYFLASTGYHWLCQAQRRHARHLPASPAARSLSAT
jgi:O-antigen ligase